MSFLSIRDLDLNGKRVFIRVDFNVPLQKNEQGEMEITSDKRIKASLQPSSTRSSTEPPSYWLPTSDVPRESRIPR